MTEGASPVPFKMSRIRPPDSTRERTEPLRNNLPFAHPLGDITSQILSPSSAMDVPTNEGVERLLSNGINNLEVHEKYIVPPNERPRISDISYTHSIPVVDLTDLDGRGRAGVVHQIKGACEEFGFFQVVNHGVPEEITKGMMDVAKEFFEMPVEDRACLYSEDQKQAIRVSTSFNVGKDKILHWRDYLRHPCHPLEEFIDSWPRKPSAYIEVASRYSRAVRALALRLLAAISEAMGLDSDYLNRTLGKHNQVLLINYYPPCPKPELAFGLPGHSDPNAITVLLQGDVSGLQVLKDGKWVQVEPIPNAFVINLADQLQVVSNGKFKSVEHRAITNTTSARISIPTFYGPSNDAFITPTTSMIDDQHPALFRGYKFEEFMDVFSGQGLRRKSVLDHFQI